MNGADHFFIVLALLFTGFMLIRELRRPNEEEPMKQEYKDMIKNEELTRKQLEQKLEQAQRELQQAKNDAISKDNYAKAEVRKKELEVEAAEWVKVQPNYYVLVTKLDGMKIKTQEFVATASVRINELTQGQYTYRERERSVAPPLQFDVHINKVESKDLAQKFINESKNGKVIYHHGFQTNEHSNSTVIGDLTILNHAIESFEIIEVKAKK